MTAGIGVYLEVGAKRVFANAVDWPGWSRSGKDEGLALAALVAYARRYASSIGDGAAGFEAPGSVRDLRIVERLEGDATTDFGAPGAVPAADGRRVTPAELRRLAAILEAARDAVDAAATRAAGVRLRTGPRGGGRSVDAIVEHVAEADRAYLSAGGGAYRRPPGIDLPAFTAEVRAAILGTLAARARGDELPPSRRRKPPWPPRYLVRRSAWHALDHAWEIEDRAAP